MDPFALWPVTEVPMTRVSALLRSIPLQVALVMHVGGCQRDLVSAVPPCTSCGNASSNGARPDAAAGNLAKEPSAALPTIEKDDRLDRGTAASSDAGDDPCQVATSQLELNQCWGNMAKRSQAEVKRLAGAVERTLESRSDRVAVDRQRAAQSEWERYRDRQCELEQQRFAGGSAAAMALAQCRYRLHRQRLIELSAIQNEWTNR
jgi:uncharacterized protein YecT (DUF1311 family)